MLGVLWYREVCQDEEAVLEAACCVEHRTKDAIIRKHEPYSLIFKYCKSNASQFNQLNLIKHSKNLPNILQFSFNSPLLD
jgi:hypothetical protein